jgi:hypothetical protein
VIVGRRGWRGCGWREGRWRSAQVVEGVVDPLSEVWCVVGVCIPVTVGREGGGEIRGGDGGEGGHIRARSELACAHQAEAAVLEGSPKPESNVLVVLSRQDVQHAESGVHDELIKDTRDRLHQPRWGAAQNVGQLGHTTHAEEQHSTLHTHPPTPEATEERVTGQGGLPMLPKALHDVLVRGSNDSAEDDCVAVFHADAPSPEGVSDVGGQWVGVLVEVEQR